MNTTGTVLVVFRNSIQRVYRMTVLVPGTYRYGHKPSVRDHDNVVVRPADNAVVSAYNTLCHS